MQLLSPLSAIASFFVFLAAGTTTMSAYGGRVAAAARHAPTVPASFRKPLPVTTGSRRPLPAAGINISGLLASVGGIGVAVGLATQSVAANFVSALSLVGRAVSPGDGARQLRAVLPCEPCVLGGTSPPCDVHSQWAPAAPRLVQYSGRAFVVGDRVQLLAAGAPVVEVRARALLRQ